MKTYLFAALSALLFAGFALAQPEPGEDVAADVESVDGDDDSAVGEAVAVEDNLEPSTEAEVVEAVEFAVTEWKTAGWLAGMLGIVNVLVLLFRYPFVNELLTRSRKKWAKPLVAVILGALLGAFTVAGSGGSVVAAIVAALAGAITGLGSVGLHQLVEQTRKRDT